MFARPIDVTPIASQPGAAAYRSRGYFDTLRFDVAGEDGSIVADQQTILDIRDAEFAVVPRQGDRIEIPADGQVPPAGVFEVVSGSTDGGGLTTLILQKYEEPRPARR